MVTVDFEYYTEEFYGIEIPEERFSYYAAAAEEYLDHVTFGNLFQAEDDQIARAVCSVAECLYRDREDVEQESVDGWSVRYRERDELLQAARRTLPYELFYRGVR